MRISRILIDLHAHVNLMERYYITDDE